MFDFDIWRKADMGLYKTIFLISLLNCTNFVFQQKLIGWEDQKLLARVVVETEVI